MGRTNGRFDQVFRILDASAFEVIGLIVLIAVAVWLIFRIRARFLDGEDPAATDHLLLSQISELKREGGLSEEEYRSIKGRLVNRIDTATRGAGQQKNDASPDREQPAKAEPGEAGETLVREE